MANSTVVWQASRLVFGCVALSLFVGCDYPQGTQYPYLQFNKSDRSRFIRYGVGQVLVFENQSGQRRTYKVDKVDWKKSEYTVGFGFFNTYAAKYYDYDELSIGFQNQDGYVNRWEINYSKQPAFDSNSKPDYSNVRLLACMSMWEWNNYSGIYSVNLDDRSEIVSLNMGGKLVANVQKISSKSSHISQSVEPNRLDWDVNAMYVSDQWGIIGFGDVKNNLWLLKF